MLKTKMEVLKKTQAVELKHAKLTAKNEADKMLRTKLTQAKEAYELEFNQLCKQFELIQDDVKDLKEERLVLKQRIAYLEGIITE